MYYLAQTQNYEVPQIPTITSMPQAATATPRVTFSPELNIHTEEEECATLIEYEFVTLPETVQRQYKDMSDSPYFSLTTGGEFIFIEDLINGVSKTISIATQDLGRWYILHPFEVGSPPIKVEFLACQDRDGIVGAFNLVN
jgi:hypothetical protein